MGTERRYEKRRARPLGAAPRDIQRRLLSLSAMLIVVLLLMQQAARPESWGWLWGGNAPADLPNQPTDAPTLAVRPAAGPGSGVLPGLDTSLFENIEDDSFFQQDEQAAWFAVLQALRRTPDEQLDALSLGQVSYLQIYRQTPEYRGRLVTLEGTIRRAVRVSAAENDAGIREYWQVWLFPNVRPMEPIVVYVLDPPRDLPEGMSLNLPARVTGIVFKRWSFQAVDELRVAPTVLARSIELIWPVPGQASSDSIANHRRPLNGRALVFAGLATSLAAIMLVVFVIRHTPRKLGRPRHSLPPSLPEAVLDFSSLSGIADESPANTTRPESGPSL